MTDRRTTTATSPIRLIFNRPQMAAALLVAHGYEWALDVKSYFVGDSLTIGRNASCDLVIQEYGVSSRHARISFENETFFIEDLNSKNGTFVDGYVLHGKAAMENPSTVIRISTTVFVFVRDAAVFREGPVDEQFGIAGRYYPGFLLKELTEASQSTRHLLLAGETGTGKEPAARALSLITGKKIRFFNCARYTSEEEAAVTLFGVGAKVFSNVNARIGLIEEADGGILFLDEVHNLPVRLQRSLLRIMEDGKLERIGESAVREVDIQFVFASNAPPPTYELANDFLARLRTIELLPLRSRVADVPSIFDHLFQSALSHRKIVIENLDKCVETDHYEALCLDGFETNNIRGIVDLVDRLVTGINLCGFPAKTINQIFQKRFADGPVSRSRNAVGKQLSASVGESPGTLSVGSTAALAQATRARGAVGASHYETHKQLIIDTYQQSGQNLTATEAALKEQGISCSRRWLSVFLDSWGVKKTLALPR